MAFSAEDIISRCVQGRAPRDVIREIEEMSYDIREVKRNLEADLLRVKVEAEVVFREKLVEVSCYSSSMEIVHQLLDTYSNVYPELRFDPIAKARTP